MGMLAVKDLFVSYGQTPALSGVSFDVGDGAVGLLGPNGAGKSTLIKAILGLVPPSRGTITLMGEKSVKLGPAIRDMIGYVPERDGVRSGLSGIGWAALLGEISGLPRRSAVERAHEVLQYVGLGEARYRPAQEYSTGMQQRLKLAGALVHDPSLVLLDEPTAGMDPKGREEMLDLCRDLVKQGKSLLFSTHILRDVEAVCSEVVILHKGKVVAGAGIEKWTRSEAQHFIVQWNGEGEEFISACKAAGFSAGKAQSGLFKVILPPEKSPRSLFSAVSGSSGTIHRMVQESTSLEEVFLEALGKNGEAK